MSWTVGFSTQATKQYSKLPEKIRKRVALLLKEIETDGPIRFNWKNYGQLKGQAAKGRGECHHCHVQKGRPTYVACWEVKGGTVKIVEVYYVGTHEKAPY